MVTEQYVRNAELVRVIDGDTLVVDIDLGFGVWLRQQRVRVLWVNCPEMHGATKGEGRDAKAFTQAWFEGRAVTIRTEIEASDTDSFGRVLAEVWQGERSLGADLLSSGHAVSFRKPA